MGKPSIWLGGGAGGRRRQRSKRYRHEVEGLGNTGRATIVGQGISGWRYRVCETRTNVLYRKMKGPQGPQQREWYPSLGNRGARRRVREAIKENILANQTRRVRVWRNGEHGSPCHFCSRAAATGVCWRIGGVKGEAWGRDGINRRVGTKRRDEQTTRRARSKLA
jgi:hypothetical protein